MEGVGARLGRSSTRYGPATVFSGPVRKWKKRWVHVSPSSSSSSSSNHNNTINRSNSSSTNGNNGSHLLLYKWTPSSHSQPPNNDDPPPHDPPRRQFKYIPVYLLEKEQQEDAERDEDEAKTSDAEPIPKDHGFQEKPDINDTLMEDTQSRGDNKVVRQDLNESTLDLSLNLNSHDEGDDSDQPRDGQLKE